MSIGERLAFPFVVAGAAAVILAVLAFAFLVRLVTWLARGLCGDWRSRR